MLSLENFGFSLYYSFGFLRGKMKQTKPEVFIIESLHETDPREGEVIKNILEMSDRSPRYLYFKSREDFRSAIRAFDESNYRYLHISSHGRPGYFGFEFGRMDFLEFYGSVHQVIQNKRVSISACEIVNHQDNQIAELLLKGTGCYSVIGSYEPINFDDAVVFWSNFYFLAYKEQPEGRIKLNRGLVLTIMRRLTGLYHLNMNYYSYSRSKGIKLTQLQNGKSIDFRLVN